MTDKDFGLAGVTDKLKRPRGKSEPVTQYKGKSDTVEPITVKPDTVSIVTVKSNTVESDTVESAKVSPVTVKTGTDKPNTDKSLAVSPDKDEADFRQEALTRLSNPSIKVLQQAVEIAKKKPRIGVYSPIVSAAAEYLRETVPKYSASDEARKILEDEFERRYPELVRRIKAEIK